MMTRAQYMDSAGTPQANEAHRAYYGQFVTAQVKALVARTIRIDRIKRSTDPHLNDIRLHRWDRLVPLLPRSVAESIKAAGDFMTLAGGVCVLKEAARQLAEEA